MSATMCPLCDVRKAKRSCPALGRAICSVCCATKRQVEIRCPSGCPYLSSARTHPAAVIQRRQERDFRFMLPLIADLTEEQHQVLLYLQGLVVEHARGVAPPLLDEDVAAAATAVAATLETAGKGIIYQHQATSIPAQRLADRLARAIDELAAQAGSARGRLERTAAVALRQLASGASTAARALPEDEPPVYLRLLGRLLTPSPVAEPDSARGLDTPDPARRLIIPG